MTSDNGVVVEKNNVGLVYETIRKIKNKEINFKMEGTSFSKDYYFNKYIELYTALTDKNEEK